jgi:phage tail sheath gpL-like
MSIQIQSFSNADKVPGAYGEVVYGAGGQTAGSIPLVLLLVGMQGVTGTAGNLTPDTQVQAVNSLADIDYWCAPGSELACMAYDALQLQNAVQIYVASPTAAGGAAAATATLTITLSTGTNPATGGSLVLRVDGYPVIANYSVADTVTTIATAVASAINGALAGRIAVSATSSLGVVTISCKTPGVRGNQRILFVDPSSTRTSNVVTALAGGTAVTGGGVPMSTGSGLETYTALLATIVNRQFDRIGLACNDATSLGLWNTQVTTTDPQATVGVLEHAVLAMNGTLAATQSIAGTTLNSQRFQVLWQLNSETPPWRMAAAFAADRAFEETNDPAKPYAGYVVSTITPQSQQADWPNHTTQVACLNTGVTPVITNGDGKARICRGITSHCLNGSNPDFSTLDTSQAVVPDFVVQYFEGYYRTIYQPANPRVQPDPSANDPLPVSGVAYPSNWNGIVLGQLRKMEGAQIPGTCPPIITGVSQNLPVSEFNPVGKRIMSAIPTNTAAGNYQVGLSVRQTG